MSKKSSDFYDWLGEQRRKARKVESSYDLKQNLKGIKPDSAISFIREVYTQHLGQLPKELDQTAREMLETIAQENPMLEGDVAEAFESSLRDKGSARHHYKKAISYTQEALKRAEGISPKHPDVKHYTNKLESLTTRSQALDRGRHTPLGIIALAVIGAGALTLTPRITGNVIGVVNSTPQSIGLIMILMGLLIGYFSLR